MTAPVTQVMQNGSTQPSPDPTQQEEAVSSDRRGRLQAFFSSFHSFICMMGGADLRYLQKALSDANEFFGRGCLVFVPALAAVYGFGTVGNFIDGWSAAIMLGLVGGCAMLMLDFSLLKSMAKINSIWKKLRASAPRFLLTVIVATLLSYILLIPFFRAEVTKQAIEDGELNSQRYRTEVVDSRYADKKAKAEAVVKTDEARIAAAAKATADATTARNDAQRDLDCEVAGASKVGNCGAKTGVPGWGPEAKAYASQLEIAKSKLKDAQDKEQKLRADLKPELTRAYQDLEDVRTGTARDEEAARTRNQDNIGLIDQLHALHHLRSASSDVNTIAWLIEFTLIGFDLVCIVAAIFTSTRAYCAVVEAAEAATITEAERELTRLKEEVTNDLIPRQIAIQEAEERLEEAKHARVLASIDRQAQVIQDRAGLISLEAHLSADNDPAVLDEEYDHRLALARIAREAALDEAADDAAHRLKVHRFKLQADLLPHRTDSMRLTDELETLAHGYTMARIARDTTVAEAETILAGAQAGL